jgi:hypothetical protein
MGSTMSRSWTNPASNACIVGIWSSWKPGAARVDSRVCGTSTSTPGATPVHAR